MNIKNKTNFIVRTDTINDYLRDINAYKTLTPEGERALFEKYNEMKRALNFVKNEYETALEAYKQDRNEVTKMELDMARSSKVIAEKSLTSQMDAVRNEILARNQRFVLAIAKRYATGDLLPDVISEGNIGLITAFDSYDVATGNRFCSYAVWYIRRQINHFITSESVMVRSTNNTRVLPKVKKFKNDFFAINGRNPGDNEIIEFLEKEGVSITNESEIYGVKMEYIDAAMGDDDDDMTLENSSEFSERTASTNTYMETVESDALSEDMKNALESLSERERTIVKMSAGVGYNKEYTNKEIAEKIGLTAERVRQLRIAALAKMKSSLSESNR